MRSIFYRIAALLSLILILVSCGDDPVSPQNTATIEVLPEELSLSNNETGTLWLSLSDAKAFNWEITKKPEWLAVGEESGTSHGELVKLRFTGTEKVEGSRTLKGEIVIAVPGVGKKTVKVTLAINDSPKLQLDKAVLNFQSASMPMDSLLVKNIGGGVVAWKALPEDSTLIVAPTSGTVASAESSLVRIYLNSSRMKSGTYSKTIKFCTDRDTALVRAKIKIPYMLYIKTINSLEVGPYVNDTSFVVANYGNADVDFSFSGVPACLELTPATGKLNGGDSVRINVKVKREALEAGYYAGKFSLNYSANYSYSSCSISYLLSNYVEKKTTLDYTIADIAYIPEDELVVLATRMPSALILMNFNGTVVGNIALHYPPMVLSNISKDKKIVVGSSGKLTLVNLNSRSVEKIWGVTCDPVSLVYAPNDYAYVSAGKSTWEPVRSVNMLTGKEENSSREIYPGSLFAMHPSGKYLYYVNPSIYSNEFDKFDLRDGKAKLAYENHTSEHYGAGSNIWVANDGSKIYSSSGNTFNCSEDKFTDMAYTGNIGLKNINSLAQGSDGTLTLVYHKDQGGLHELTTLCTLDKYYNVLKSYDVPVYLYKNPGNQRNPYRVASSYCYSVFLNRSGSRALMFLLSRTNSLPNGSVAKVNWSYYIMDLK